MTRIDFYILQEEQTEARLHFACRLIEKARRQGNKVFVATDSPQQAERLDQLLWSFKPESFVPHSMEYSNTETQSPVLIGNTEDCADHHDVLINLSSEIPLYFSRFERLIEVVCQHTDVLQATRQHFAFYRERGYPIQSNDLRLLPQQA